MEEMSKICIVDDNMTSLSLARDMLKTSYKVYPAPSAEKFFEIIENIRPDLILMDVEMPVMNGYEAVKILKEKEQFADIPVIFLTAKNDDESELKGFELGAVDYITKPFHPAIIKARISTHLTIIEQRRLNIEKERNEKNSRARVDFLTRMNHEMFTPMNAIIGMTQVLNMQMMKSPEVAAIVKKPVDEIDSASKYLLRLLQDLLDISGKKEGSFTLDETAFCFRDVVYEVIKGVEPDSMKKQQKITSDISAEIPASLAGDPERLAQVMTNLLTNAVKFTPEHGEISISADVLNQNDAAITLQIEVSDNGIGIEKERHDEIFTLFSQGEGSMTRKRGGIGLGLPISRRIIGMMNGEIRVESELGKGSKFIFTCELRKD